MMKLLNLKLITFTILFFTSFNPIFSQESYVDNKSSKIFILQGNTIVYDGYPKTLREAKIISKEFSSSFSHFERAKIIRGWNIVWGLAGGYEALAGTINLLSGYGIGFLDMAIGGGLIALVINREKKFNREIQLGIEAFNKQRLKEFPKPILNKKKVKEETLNKDKTQQLFDLKKLLDAGVLTKEEFDKEKKKILNQ